MTQTEAYNHGYCETCCSWRNNKCWATAMPSMNYREIPAGMCDLTMKEQREMENDKK